jgi:hypothetical protein
MIPIETKNANGNGSIVDNRAPSGMDPYIVCAHIADAISLEKSKFVALSEHYSKWVDQMKKIDSFRQ